MAILAVWQLPRWLEDSARSYLSAQGIDDFSIGTTHWGWGEVVLDRLSLTGVRDGMRFNLAVERTAIRYHWRDLPRGRVALVRAEGVSGSITLPEAAGAGGGNGARVNSLLLPQNWLPELPINNIVLNRVAVDLRHRRGPALCLESPGFQIDSDALSLEGALTLAAREPSLGRVALEVEGLPLRLRLSLVAGEKRIVTMSVRQTGDVAGADRPGSPLRYAVGGDIQLAPFRQWLAALSGYSEQIGAIIGDEWPPLDGDSEFTLDVLIPPGTAGGEASSVALALQGRMRHRLEVPDWPGTGLSALSLSLEHQLRLAGKSAEITLLSPIAVTGLLTASAGARLPTTDPLSLSLALDTDEVITVDGTGATLTAARLESTVNDNALSGRMTAHLHNLVADRDSVRGEWQSRVQGSWHGKNLPPVALDGRIERVKSAWELAGTVAQEALALDGDWRIDLDGGGRLRSARADIVLDDLPALAERLGRWFALPIDVGFTEGKGGASYRLKRTPSGGLRHEVSLALDDITGLVAGTAVQGAALGAALHWDGRWRSNRPLNLTATRVDRGVAVTDLSLIADLKPSRSLARSRVAVKAFTGSLFDGRVSLAEPFIYDMSAPSNSFALSLESLDLATILDLYPQQGLSGIGTLDGRVPITIASNVVVIDSGSLRSQPPGGVIRYKMAEAEKSLAANPQLATTFKLLEDFRYEELGSTVRLGPKGDLVLDVALSGHNPNVYGGRKVNFNISVEDNLYELLRVLRLTDDLINNLEKRLGR